MRATRALAQTLAQRASAAVSAASAARAVLPGAQVLAKRVRHSRKAFDSVGLARRDRHRLGNSRRHGRRVSWAPEPRESARGPAGVGNAESSCVAQLSGPHRCAGWRMVHPLLHRLGVQSDDNGSDHTRPAVAGTLRAQGKSEYLREWAKMRGPKSGRPMNPSRASASRSPCQACPPSIGALLPSPKTGSSKRATVET